MTHSHPSWSVVGRPNRVQVKKDTSHVRLVSDRGSYVFEFPTKGESMRFLTSLTEALKRFSVAEKRTDKDEQKDDNDEGILRDSSGKDRESESVAEREGKVTVNLASSLDEDYKPSPRTDSKCVDPLISFIRYSLFYSIIHGHILCLLKE